MVSIGGNPLTTLLKVPNTNIIITIGSDTYGLVEEHTYESHYAENTDPVTSSNTQVITPGAFLGELTLTCLFSTDLPSNWSTLSYGDLPTKTVVIAAMNTAGVVKALTFSYCRIFRHGGRGQKDQLYRRTIRILYPAPETWS